MRVAIILLLASLLFTACSQPGSRQLVAQVASPMPTTTYLFTPSPTLTGPELDATKITYIQKPIFERQTRVAAGITPIATFVVVPTSEPVPTPFLGISGECAQANRVFNYGGCWAGVVNGQYLFVGAGTRRSDADQGVLRVYTRTADLQTYGPVQWYSTPSKLGSIVPTQVVWPLLTLITESGTPPTTFIFDLATRQWVNP